MTWRYGLAISSVVFLGACGDATKPCVTTNTAPSGPPFIASVKPSETVVKTAFNVQPDGSSAFSLTGTNFSQGSVVVANGERLPTAFGNPEWLSADVPAALYAKAGTLTVKVVGPDGKESNSSDFKVGDKQ